MFRTVNRHEMSVWIFYLVTVWRYWISLGIMEQGVAPIAPWKRLQKENIYKSLVGKLITKRESSCWEIDHDRKIIKYENILEIRKREREKKNEQKKVSNSCGEGKRFVRLR